MSQQAQETISELVERIQSKLFVEHHSWYATQVITDQLCVGRPACLAIGYGRQVLNGPDHVAQTFVNLIDVKLRYGDV